MLRGIVLYGKYVNSAYYHIIPGDLNIVEKENLSLLMNYEQSIAFHLKCTVNQKMKHFNLDLNPSIYKFSIDYNIPMEHFTECKCNALRKLNLELYKHLQYINDIYIYIYIKSYSNLEK